MTSIRCKFIDGQGEPVGWAEVPPMYGVVNVEGRFYGRMFNGDDDKDKFPFIFADADVLVLTKLEELTYEPSERERKGATAGVRSKIDSDGVHAKRNAGVRRDQLKAARGRRRNSY